MKKSIALFLNASLIRVRFGMEIVNPFLEDVKKIYPAIFSACFTGSQVYEGLIGVLPTEDEISYMSVLFGGAMSQKKKMINALVIGSSGVGIAQIMARKIEEKIPEINVVSILAANAVRSIEKGQYDLIITTLSKFQKKELDFVYTTPIVDDLDVSRIKRACKQIECEKLYEDGYVKNGFYEDVLRREGISSSALGDGARVDVVFLLALNFKEIQQTRAFFGAFYEMTVEHNSAELIRKAQTKEEIRKIIG